MCEDVYSFPRSKRERSSDLGSPSPTETIDLSIERPESRLTSEIESVK